MSTRPTSGELVEAVQEMMQQTLLPALDDPSLVYQCRVSLNILQIVQRELAQGPEAEHEEAEGLQRLLGTDAELSAMRAELISRIRQGDFDDNTDDLLAHLKTVTMNRVAIDNPRYSTYRDYSSE